MRLREIEVRPAFLGIGFADAVYGRRCKVGKTVAIYDRPTPVALFQSIDVTPSGERIGCPLLVHGGEHIISFSVGDVSVDLH